MARTVVTSTKLAHDADLLAPAGTAVDVANGMVVVCNKNRRTLIVITNTAAATKVVTVVRPSPPASENPSADFSSQAIPITTGMDFLGPFTGRYTSVATATDPYGIWLNFVAGHTGVVYALELPVS